MARQTFNLSCSSRNEIVFKAFRPTARALSSSVAYGSGAPKKRNTSSAGAMRKIEQIKKIVARKEQDSKKSLQYIKKMQASMKMQARRDRQDKKRLLSLAAKAKKQLQPRKKAATPKRATPKKVSVRKTNTVRVREFLSRTSINYYY